MAKGYEKELRFYVNLHQVGEDGKVMSESAPAYIDWFGTVSYEFLTARQFESFDAAKTAAQAFEAPFKCNKVVRSVYVEICGFDLGAIV